MAYVQSYRYQNWLLPLSIKDMIPKDHICFLVEEFVEGLDFSRFDIIYDGAGHPAYHPRIIMKVLIQGMLDRVRSSRKLAMACRENVVFMYLAEKVSPDFRTIARFRKENHFFVKNAFKTTVELAEKSKFLDLSFISIDGTMLKANAGKKQYFDKNGLGKLDKAIDRMVDDDIKMDKLEEQMFGNKEEGLTGFDERDLRKIVREYRNNQNKQKIKKNIKKAKNDLEKYGLKKVSISDPESRMMQNKKGFSELSYNVQIAVSKNQIIVSNDLCQDKHDVHQLIPQIQNIKDNVTLAKRTRIGVDCGYSDGINIKFAEDNKIDLYVPSRTQAQKFDGKTQSLNHDKYEYDAKKNELIADGIRYPYHHSYTRKNNGKKIIVYQLKGAKQRKQVPEFFRERLRMKEKMEKPESRKIYRLRKITVEPVYGNLKQNMGLREFLLRGLDKAKIELNLACIAHNLKKIWTMRAAKGC